MAIPIQETIKRDYERPAMRVYEVKYRVNLMSYSRTNYSKGGEGFSDSGMGGRYGYGDGGEGFGVGGFGAGSGYGDGGEGFGGSSMGGRSGYDDGGDGFY